MSSILCPRSVSPPGLRAEQEEWTAAHVHTPDGGSVRLRPQGELAKRGRRGNKKSSYVPSDTNQI